MSPLYCNHAAHAAYGPSVCPDCIAKIKGQKPGTPGPFKFVDTAPVEAKVETVVVNKYAGIAYTVWASDPDVHQRLAEALVSNQPEPVVDAILNECKDAECAMCACLCCALNDPMHFHHDGCPSCSQLPDAEFDATQTTQGMKS